ncbi:PH domain-containing protein [Roseibacillus persicicus]|uniref:YdbS-like PH domain-containing protein n=1 Tax=Roseibacillus persicicus TaxID=454148 RepID=A0A918TX27_9BACT|nr:PH domain-containing protein [Roseibacillus persicicus]MDQ8191620.1 PH domain-containing protein [Roseibacillus persicicus]GHC60499.1 hypothetical protein GCM10007100_29820 [Roseibacillus persicicus]
METNEINEDEDIIWRGHPSQLLNLGTHVVCVLLAAGIVVGAILSGILPLMALALVPLAWAFWKYLTIRCRVFELTSERLRLYEGVLNQEIGEVELYRVKDTNLIRPFWLRVFGLATIKADTSDRSHPIVDLEAIKDGVKVRELLRKQVEKLRDKKRVREVDFDGSGDGDELEFES